MQLFCKNLEHIVKFIETDEFMLAVDVVDAGQTAQSLAFALAIQTDHYDLLSGVRRAFFTERVVFLETHIDKDLYKAVKNGIEIEWGQHVISMRWRVQRYS